MTIRFRSYLLFFLTFLMLFPVCFSGMSATKETARTLEFSGMTWQVRSGTGNPGANNWSDSSESVWVDDDGLLHLKIRIINGKWYCSEIYTEESVGYGEYRFYVASNVEILDKNVVLGLFTYANDLNEVDIEFSKWGNANQQNMGYYVTQPAGTAGNSYNFALNLNGTYSTHRFIWTKNDIDYKSWHGHAETANENTLIQHWNYTGKSIPVPGPEKLILNLWLFKGLAPSDGKEVEVLIKAVKVNAQPVVNNLTLSVPETAPLLYDLGTLETPGYSPEKLNYSIIEGNELNWFSVSDSGKIILVKNPDYETAPFQILKIASSIGDQSDTALVHITVENVNDNIPVAEGFVAEIPEDFPVQHKIGQLTFFDADGDSLFFEITGGNENQKYAVSNRGEIILKRPLDFETNLYDSLLVGISDGIYDTIVSVIIRISNVVETGSSMPENAEILLYPNPVRDWLNVVSPGNKPVDFRVVHMFGRTFEIQDCSFSSEVLKINTRQLIPGNYLLILNFSDRVRTYKFSKQ